jgi:hypothetical protein
MPTLDRIEMSLRVELENLLECMMAYCLVHLKVESSVC